MRIGFDAKRLFQNATGLGNYSRTLVANLHKYHPEHDIHLYAPKLVKNERTLPFFNKGYKPFSPSGITKLGWRSMGVVKALKNDGIELYHGLSHELPIGIKNSGLKTVVTIHDLLYKYFPEDFPLFDRLIYDNKFRFACEHSDKIIAISNATKQDIMEHYKVPEAKVQVIYQTVSPEFSREISDFDAEEVIRKYALPSEYILNVGSIIRRKNLEIVIIAMAMMQPKDRMPLVIVGTGGTYATIIDQLVEKHKLKDWIIRITGPTLEELNILYRKSHFSVYPSLMEGFGLPVLESIMTQTPVITTRRSSLIEAGGDIAHYINGENAEELSVKMMELTYKAKQIGDPKNIKKHLDRFDAKKLTEQLNDLYLANA